MAVQKYVHSNGVMKNPGNPTILFDKTIVINQEVVIALRRTDYGK